MKIRLISGSEIDKTKWNSCVHYAGNGNVFGYMWYLDHIAKEWDALVEGDYESVFPLVWRKGVFLGKELHQPGLMRALGIYSIHLLSDKRIRAFLDAIPEAYRLVDIVLNERNRPPEDAGFEVMEKTNHQLLLNAPYEVLAESFSAKRKQQLEEAEQNGLLPASGLKPETIAAFYREHSGDRKRERNFHGLQRIMYNVLHRGWGFPSGVLDKEGKLCAVDFFIYSHGRVMSLTPVASPAGRQQYALPYLYNLLIQTQANRPLLLDFNTSEKSELATGFSANPNTYYRIRKDNRLLGLF